MARIGTRFHFAAIPVRALGDPELHGADFKVLGVISYFDRFSRNGSGCYATQARMAEMTGLAIPTVSAAIKKLCALGYLDKARQENRRRHQYRVLHDAAMGSNSSPTDEVSAHDSSPTDEVSGLNTSSTGETKIFPEGEERYSVETASSQSDALEDIPQRAASAGADARTPYCFAPVIDDDCGQLRAKVARFERFVKSRRRVSSDELTVAQELLEAMERAGGDLQEMAHVERVAGDIEMALNDEVA